MKIMRYTAEEKQFLFEYIPGHTYIEIRDEFTRRFRPITKAHVKSFSNNNHVRTGLSGRYPKGNVPWNKGTHYHAGGRAKETQFKAGNIPPQYRPVGSTRICRDGYLEVKIEDPNKWDYAHRVLWEKAHGKIPEGHVVIFRDGNKENITLENLACIPRSTLSKLTAYRLHGSGEYFDAALATMELVAKVKEVKKKRHVGTK